MQATFSAQVTPGNLRGMLHRKNEALFALAGPLLNVSTSWEKVRV